MRLMQVLRSSNRKVRVEGRDCARRGFMYEDGHDVRKLPLFDFSGLQLQITKGDVI